MTRYQVKHFDSRVAREAVEAANRWLDENRGTYADVSTSSYVSIEKDGNLTHHIVIGYRVVEAKIKAEPPKTFVGKTFAILKVLRKAAGVRA